MCVVPEWVRYWYEWTTYETATTDTDFADADDGDG